MDELTTRALALKLGYAYRADHGRTWTGFSRTLEEAQQACQGVAAAPLDWRPLHSSWTAHDTTLGTLYRIERLNA